MLALIAQVREKVRGAFGVELENEVILWAGEGMGN
jgi:UDP-N-acetylenolpyruvoylglucosamine reductase